MSDFQKIKLSDICSFGNDKIAVSNLKISDYISTENMLQDKAGISLSARFPTSPQTTVYQKNDVLISNIRPYFKKIWFANRNGGCSNDVLVMRAKANCSPDFLYYILSDKNFFDYATATAKGTKMPRGDKVAIMQYEIPNLPPLSEQKAIASVLGALDDKIELNKRINANLEAQAQAIFKSWFVDFEPWGGVMPDDWEVGLLSDYCIVKSGFAFKSSWWQDQGIRVIKIKNITSDAFDLSNCSFVSEDKLIYAKEFIVSEGDLLIAMTGATLGKFTIVPRYDETLLVNQRVGKFFIGRKPLDRLPFLWCFLKQEDVSNEIINRGQGSAQPNISPTDIHTISIILPSNRILNEFNNALRSSFEKIVLNTYESLKLASLRDTLLPKLMSGEIRINYEGKPQLIK